jgi:hypothetical protein
MDDAPAGRVDLAARQWMASHRDSAAHFYRKSLFSRFNKHEEFAVGDIAVMPFLLSKVSDFQL